MSALSKSKKIAMIGTGRMGMIRMQQLQLVDGLKLGGIVDSNMDNGEKFGEKYNVPHYKTVSDLMNDKSCQDIDGVWISSPTDTHYSLIDEIVSNSMSNSGNTNIIGIGLEKPVCMEPKDTEECYTKCHDNNISLFCSFQRRTDPSYCRLSNDIKEGKLGEIQTLNSYFRDHPVPSIEFLKRGGDLFHDCGVHDIDYARSLNKNSEIIYVSAFGHSFNNELRENNILDVVKGLCMFDNGVMYHIEVSRTSTYGYDQRFECFGNIANGKIENINETSYQCETSNGIELDKYDYSFPQRYEHAFRQELRLFCKVLNDEKEETLVNVFDACRATQVAEACSLSAKHFKPVYIRYDEKIASKCEYSFDKFETLLKE